MRKVLIPIFCLGIVITAQAESLYEQLVAFNPNWQSYEGRVIAQEAFDFPSDKEYIQTHLTHVLEILRSNETETLNCAQLQKRKELIEVLDAYKERGLFPMNYYRNERIPVFIDEHNTHCAVGYLLKYTGYDHVAQRISEKNNYAWVIEIDDPVLPAWQQFSGFTLEELKLIQGAYDYYPPVAVSRVAPNKTEIPQKPDVIVLNFEGEEVEEPNESDLLSVWCYGEGTTDVLHGRWIQNYRNGIPWIEGYFENGKRTGSWKEYYMGTNILCRTEHWRNDKLNGVRTRYDRQGNVIERITFKDGDAVEKVNYDLRGDIKWVRKPLDSLTLETEAYSLSGYLLAKGQEQISNPTGRLQWFQDIELTALNTFAISERDGAPQFTHEGAPIFANQLDNTGAFYVEQQNPLVNGMPTVVSRRVPMFQSTVSQEPTLVNYIKVGAWKYYNEYSSNSFIASAKTSKDYLKKDFEHFGIMIHEEMKNADVECLQRTFDSLSIQYEAGMIRDFKGHAYDNTPHLGFIIDYVQRFSVIHYLDFGQNSVEKVIRAMGELDENGHRIGEWTIYDDWGRPSQYVKYVQPFKEEEPVTGSINEEFLMGETTR